MKHYLATVGLRADGYRMELEKLEDIGVPFLALININGYLHFVVVKGSFENEVLLGDPALGMRKMKKDEFKSIWNGIAFVIKDEIQTARSHFNKASEWKIREFAKTESALSLESLAHITANAAVPPGYF